MDIRFEHSLAFDRFAPDWKRMPVIYKHAPFVYDSARMIATAVPLLAELALLVRSSRGWQSWMLWAIRRDDNGELELIPMLDETDHTLL